jgi:hypothetical protein
MPPSTLLTWEKRDTYSLVIFLSALLSSRNLKPHPVHLTAQNFQRGSLTNSLLCFTMPSFFLVCLPGNIASALLVPPAKTVLFVGFGVKD